MIIKILPEEKEALKKVCALSDLAVFFHENELKSEATGMQLDYTYATIEGFQNPEHVWVVCRTFSLELEIQEAKSMKR